MRRHGREPPLAPPVGGHLPFQFGPAALRRRQPQLPPSCSARPVPMLRSPLRGAPPDAAAVIPDQHRQPARRSTSTVTRTWVARACRAALESASRSTASRCSASSPRWPAIPVRRPAAARARSRAAAVISSISDEDLRPQAVARRPAGLQREDRGPDVPDRVVHGVHGVAEPLGHLGPGDHGQRALQRHPGRVEPLDDQVVQVTARSGRGPRTR